MYEEAHYGRGEHVAEVEDLLRWCGGRGTRVLDVGCSGGLHALEFARRGFRVVGIDVEPSAVHPAGSRAAALGLEFGARDAAHGLGALGRFDLIYSIGNVLSHLSRGRASRGPGGEAGGAGKLSLPRRPAARAVVRRREPVTAASTP